jgi:uncharacterized surface protein with fasciclin (FAS1) repeats
MVFLATSPAFAGNLLQELEERPRFATLVAAIKAAGLADAVRNCTNCTLFAPNNQAFLRLPAGTVAGLLLPGNKGKLGAILTYHLVASRIPAAAVPTTPTLVQTVNVSQAKIRAVRSGSTVRINGIRVVNADIRANQSIIHEIGDVLFPGEIRH